MVAVFFVAVSALLATVPSVLATPQTSPSHLFSRQLSGIDPSKIPSSCLNSKCQALADQLSKGDCTTLDCLCTNDIVSAIKACDQCILDAGGVTQDDIDNAMQAFAQGCSAAGHPVSGVSTGGSSGGSSASSGGSSASSGGSSATGSATKTGSGGATTATTPASGGTTSPAKSDGTVLSAGVIGSILAFALGAMNL